MSHALFVGLTTLDLIYLVEQAPQANQKAVAQNFCMAAGGPATNAAIAFATLQNHLPPSLSPPITPHLLTSLSQHPLAQLAQADLQTHGVIPVDLTPTNSEPLPLSSIWVHAGTGDRTVVSLNATRVQASADAIPADILDDVAIVLMDGHQMAVSEVIAQAAQAKGIPVIVDGGSWKPGFERVLRYCNGVIASANFCPPGTQTEAEGVQFLQALGIPHIAITHGAGAIAFWENGQAGSISVPTIQAVDTLGAGDIFHGAFCHFWLQENLFELALQRAAEVGAIACQSFGTRAWIQDL